MITMSFPLTHSKHSGSFWQPIKATEISNSIFLMPLIYTKLLINKKSDPKAALNDENREKKES